MRARSELRPYQTRVVDYLYENPEAFAVLKMGAGKTASTLTAILDLLGDKVIRHALVIAPKRVAKLVWPDEVKKWQHLSGLRMAVLDGPPPVRLRKLLAIDSRDVTVVGIDNVQWLVDAIEDWPADHPIFDALVIDETSKLKSPKGKRAKALAKVAKRFKNRWGLTGTPRPNSLLDLFTPAKIITGGRLWGNSYYKWQMDNFYLPNKWSYDWKIHPHKEAQLLADIATVSIALGEGEMPGLPGLSVIIDEVLLPKDTRDVYADMERDLFAVADDEGVIAMSRAIATGKLAQIANGFLYDDRGAAGAHIVHNEKAQWLAELVDELDGEPLIVVYEYQEDLAMIRRAFGQVPYLGSGVSDKQAQENVEAWNRGELPVFALHPASGGHGLNLQHGGSRMAWVAPTWSAELWDQTLARIYRPGQANHCMVHVCVARDTVDDLKRLRVLDKLSGQQAFEAYLASQPRLSAAASPSPPYSPHPSAASPPS
jgi:hypothetical protein